MSHIIDVQKAKELYEKGARFVDCSFRLGDNNWGHKTYTREHIPGSVYMDLERDLSGYVLKTGGRHPLPNLAMFKSKLERYGIRPDTTIVAYDQGGAPFASRFWWIMKYIGHEKIYVLNGGFQEWKKQGFPTDNKVTFYLPTDYHMNIQEQLYADVNDIRKVVAKEKQAVLIDSREKKRYLGEFEPIDPIPGHIPGAINKFWLDGVDPDGKFLDIEKQKERFKDISPDKEIIVYCGSGVTAAPNVLLLNSIGFSKVKLYVGSYSDWVSYQEHPVEKEEPME